MLSITLTPTMLVFVGLSDELWEIFSQEYDLREHKKGHCIKGKPEELYKILLKLSYTYDIEVF